MKLWEAGIDNARREANKLLRRFGVMAANHVNVEGFARRLGLHLVDAPLHGATAQLVVGSGHACIILADRLRDPGERRWAVAHELGHYVLQHRAPPPETLLGPRPRHRVADLPDDEDEADCFALALLTPERTVSAFRQTRAMTLIPPLVLAGACGVSLEASAIRIAESTGRACAVMLSTRSGIRWVAPARLFVDAFGAAPALGRPLDPRSVAWRSLDHPALTQPEIVPGAAWLDVPGEPPILEHSLPGSEPGTVLTMLWAPYRDVARQIHHVMPATPRSRPDHYTNTRARDDREQGQEHPRMATPPRDNGFNS